MTINNNGKNLKGKLTLDLPKTLDISKIGDFKVKSKKRSLENIKTNINSGSRGLNKNEIEYRKKALENYDKKKEDGGFSNNSSEILNKINQSSKPLNKVVEEKLDTVIKEVEKKEVTKPEDKDSKIAPPPPPPLL